METNELLKRLFSMGHVWPDVTSVSAALGRKWTAKERTLWRDAIYQRHTPMAITAGYAIFGRNLTIQSLAKLDQWPDAWRRRTQEAQALSPLFAARVLMGLPPPESVKHLKEACLKRGLQDAAWRWLRAQSGSFSRKILQRGPSPEAIYWLNTLAKAKQGSRVSSRYFEDGGLRGTEALCWMQLDVAQVARFCKLLPDAATPQALAELDSLVRGLTIAGRGTALRLSVQPGVTWDSLLKRISRFYAERERIALNSRELTEVKALDWQGKLGSGNVMGINFEELVTAQSLVAEGLIMDHCLKDGSYLERCALGEHVILRLIEPITGERATLQLVRSEKGSAQRPWLIGQLKSFANTRVPQVFWAVAHVLAAKA